MLKKNILISSIPLPVKVVEFFLLRLNYVKSI